MSGAGPIRNQFIQSQQSEISDLQKEYADKKKKVQKENSEQIKELNNQFEEKKQFIQEQNSAVINHIRNKQSDEHEKMLEQQIEIRDRSLQKLSETQQKYSDQIKNQKQSGESKVSQLKEQYSEEQNQIEAESKLKKQRTIETSSEDISKIKSKNNENIVSLNQQNQSSIERLKTDYQNQVKDLKSRGSTDRQNLQEKINTSLEKLQLDGERKTDREIQQQETKLEKIKKTFADKYNQQKSKWTEQEIELNEINQKKIQHAKTENERNLKNIDKNYKRLNEINQEKNQISLDIQRQNYFKQLVAQKRDFINEFQKYDGKNDDPFYKLDERGSRIREDNHFYYIKAFVPDYDKNAIQVVVQKDKASIEGKRSFVETTVDDDGKKTTQQNYQTFREEFPFTTPALPEALRKERDGDWLYVKVPKFGTSPTKIKLG